MKETVRHSRILLFVAGLAALPALAQSAVEPSKPAPVITDPTRPPEDWMPPDPNVPGATAKADDKAERTYREPLQLLLVGKTRRYAIVRGEIVGEKTGETKLVEVKPGDVTVQSERGQEKLNLFPDVEKTVPPRKQRGMGYPDIEKKDQK